MIWRDLIFDYLWERASPLGRSLIIAVIIGAFVLLYVAILQIGNAGVISPNSLRESTTTSLTSIAHTP